MDKSDNARAPEVGLSPTGVHPAMPRRGHVVRHIAVSRLAAEALLAVLAAVAVSGTLQAAIGRLHIPMPSLAPAAIAAVLDALSVLALAAIIATCWRRWSLAATVGVATCLATLTTAALALPLQGTRYYLGGISIDQAFRTQYLTRLTSSATLLDMNYVDTAPYYPAGWFWLGGRFASVLGLSGWEAYKPWALLTMALAPVASFALWSLVVRRPVAAILAFATALVGLGFPATEPYAWILGGLLPPISVIALKALGNGLGTGERPGGKHWAAVVGVGIFLGVAGAVYTLLFVFACFLLVMLAGTAVWSAKSARDLWPATRTVAVRLAVMGLVALPIMALVWAPFLVQAFRGWPGAGAAGRYLAEPSAFLPFPMLEVSLLGLVSIIGCGWLVLRFPTDATARALGVLVLACYAWFGLSTLALAAGTTLLPFRLLAPLTATLVCAGVLGALEGAQAVRQRLHGDARRAAVMGAILLAVGATVSVAQSVPLMHRDDLRFAYGDYYPTGVNALGETDKSKPGAWYAKLHETVMVETAKDPQDLVVLSNDYTLLTLHPYWSFQQTTVHYANPLADYDGRLSEIQRWAAAQDGDDFLARLDASPYRPASVFILEDDPKGYRAVLTRDAFPKHPNVERSDVVFDKALFSPERFARTVVGPFVVLTRR